MERCRYAVAGRNKQAHAVFIEKLTGLRREFEKEGAGTNLAERIYTEFADRLSDHILTVDWAPAAVVPPRPVDSN